MARASSQRYADALATLCRVCTAVIGEIVSVSLAKRLVDVPQPEKGGKIAQERFHYQALWGMMLVFRSYGEGGDFAIAFEFHDDIVSLNSAVEPTKVKFYQIKTKDKGHWLLSDLFRRTANKETGEKLPSHIGRLFSRLVDFPSQTASLSFVSNAPLRDNTTGRNEVSFKECGPEHFTAFLGKLREEHAEATEDQAALLRYEKAGLSLEDAATHAKGAMNDFIVSSIGPIEINLDAFYKAIVEECRVRSSYTGEISSFTDLVRYKAITRQVAEIWLSQLKAHSAIPSFETLVSGLELKPIPKARLAAAWQKYRLKVLDAGDEPIRIIRKKIRDGLSRPDVEEMDLREIVATILEHIAAVSREHLPRADINELTAMILYEVAIYGVDQLSSPASQSEDQAS